MKKFYIKIEGFHSIFSFSEAVNQSGHILSRPWKEAYPDAREKEAYPDAREKESYPDA